MTNVRGAVLLSSGGATGAEEQKKANQMLRISICSSLEVEF